MASHSHQNPESILPKKSFYGNKSRNIGVAARLARKEKELRSSPAPSPYKPRLGGPSSQWKVFKSQQDAFDYTRANTQELAVFSCESDSFFEHHGQRVFLVTSYEQFWHYYKQLKTTQRHHYEVIPEGAVCHLYFDLEFNVQQNPNKNGVEMVEKFIRYVNVQLEEDFEIRCDKSDIVQLDATTSSKFSQHLVYHLPNTVFKDNINAGHFVQKICVQLRQLTRRDRQQVDEHCTTPNKRMKLVDNITTSEEINPIESMDDTLSVREKSPAYDPNSSIPSGKSAADWGKMHSTGLFKDDLEEFFIMDKDGNEALFCDTGVYTRNRNFRVYLSCKLGRNNPLMLSENNEYLPAISPSDYMSDDEQTFLDSLVANVKYHPNVKVLSFNESTNLNMLKDLTSKRNSPRGAEQLVGHHHSPRSSKQLAGHNHSPYPEIDDYIITRLNTGGTQGQIRQWSYFAAGELLLFEITKNRWCENIQRQHRSNNVFYLVDLKRGVFYQKCHDPKCKAENFKSVEYPLPKTCLPSYYYESPDEAEDKQTVNWDEVSDTDLLLAASSVEEHSAIVSSGRVPSKELCEDDGLFDTDDDALMEAAAMADL